MKFVNHVFTVGDLRPGEYGYVSSFSIANSDTGQASIPEYSPLSQEGRNHWYDGVVFNNKGRICIYSKEVGNSPEIKKEKLLKCSIHMMSKDAPFELVVRDNLVKELEEAGYRMFREETEDIAL